MEAGSGFGLEEMEYQWAVIVAEEEVSNTYIIDITLLIHWCLLKWVLHFTVCPWRCRA